MFSGIRRSNSSPFYKVLLPAALVGEWIHARYLDWKAKQPDVHGICTFRDVVSDRLKESKTGIRQFVQTGSAHYNAKDPIESARTILDILIQQRNASRDKEGRAELLAQKNLDIIHRVTRDHTHLVKCAEEEAQAVYGAPYDFSGPLGPTSCGVTTLALQRILRKNRSVKECLYLHSLRDVLGEMKSKDPGFFFLDFNNEHLAGQHINGHSFAIEKIDNEHFRIWQSFQKKYTLDGYEECSGGKIYSYREIKRFIRIIEAATSQTRNLQRAEKAFSKAFLVDPAYVGARRPDDKWEFEGTSRFLRFADKV
jgi:hypothetical protein